MTNTKEKLIWSLLRLGMGWIFIWSFFDKLFGLGFNTVSEKSWLAGGSPTFGFLKFGTYGPFASIYHAMAGNAIVDWLFMMGLLFVGLTLILGIAVRLGSYVGILMLFLIWTALLPPEHNPILDKHIIYILVLIGLTTVNSGKRIGLGSWWEEREIVKKNPVLK